MPPEIQAKLNKIRNNKYCAARDLQSSLALITFIGLGSIDHVTFGVGGIDFDGIVFRAFGFSLAHRMLLGVVTGVTRGIAFKGFYHLHRLFENYSRVEVFGRDSAGQLQGGGLWRMNRSIM